MRLAQQTGAVHGVQLRALRPRTCSRVPRPTPGGSIRTARTPSVADRHEDNAAGSGSSSSTTTTFSTTSVDWSANILQQQLPPDNSLQQLLQPLIQPNPATSSPGVPGDDVGPIAADSTSLTVNSPSPPPVAAAAAAAGAEPQVQVQPLDSLIDVQARELFSGPAPAPLDEPAAQAATAAAAAATAGAKPASEQLPAASKARAMSASWMGVVGVCAFASFLCYLDRTNISTAIVPMAEQFGWNKQFCGSVLSAFFAGYGATQVLGGQLSDKYGGSAVMCAGLTIWSLATALTPIAAEAGSLAVLAARFVLGAGQGVAFPAIHALLAKGVPSKVRSGAIGIIMACAHCGTALGFGASPGIISTLGWEWTFYVFGAAALAWLPCWMQLGRAKAKQAAQAVATTVAAVTTAAVITSTGLQTASIGTTAAVPVPATTVAAAAAAASSSSSAVSSPLLQAIEQQHLQQQAAQQQAAQQAAAKQAQAAAAQAKQPNVGFWPLMRRKEVWAIAAAQFTSGVGIYGLLAWLPQFFMEHCGLALSQLGGFTLAPYVLQGAVGASAGILSDHLIVSRGWGTRSVRVLMQVAGMMGPAVCLCAAAAPFSSHSPYIAAGLITLAMGLSALTCSGVSASHLDIAPRHAGVIFGVGNTAGTLAGLLAIPGIGWVLETTGSWGLAFGLCAFTNVVGSVLWAMWVGDKPLPEDGGEPAAAAEPVAAQAQVVMANNVVPVPNFVIPSMQGEVKFKAA